MVVHKLTRIFFTTVIATFTVTCTVMAQTVTGVRTIGAASPSGTLDNQINITVARPDVTGLAVEEFIPSGWIINSVSPAAASIINGKISWVFFANPGIGDINITYQLSVPEGAAGTFQFTGTLSYQDPANGNANTVTPITGDTEICMSTKAFIFGDPFDYSFLQDAYDDAVNNDIILVRAVAFNDDLFINMSKTVFLEAGYDCGYLTNFGVTIVNGNIIVSDGVLIVQSGTFSVQ